VIGGRVHVAAAQVVEDRAEARGQGLDARDVLLGDRWPRGIDQKDAGSPSLAGGAAMTRTVRTGPVATLRPAVDADVTAIATIWHRGWCDGHLGHVPDTVLRHRRPADFFARIPARLPATTVATIDARVIGFVTTHVDEIEQLYVTAAARGTGVADVLLAHGEAVIAASFDRAWLAVIAGNTRARRFYARNGWSDAGPFEYPAQAAGDATIMVPAHRYEKHLVASIGIRPRCRSRRYDRMAPQK
jgi:GNAT superfamily N-acetyltransferase